MDFLDFTRRVSFFTTYYKVYPGVTEVAVPQQMEKLGAVGANWKKLDCGVGGGDNPEDADREVDVAESPTPTGTRDN